MILSVFTRWTSRARLAKARRAYDHARAEYRAAEDRQDTRRMGEATRPLQVAHYELMAAEAACLPKPEPMPRGVAR